jgi:RNA polymerase sigma factor (sigma-70 family)
MARGGLAIFLLNRAGVDISMESTSTDELRGWVARLQAGEAEARDRLIACAFERLDSLARRMLRDFPRVARWEQASDIRQAALIRLRRALEKGPPETVRDFLRLAACQIRRELIDLARHYQGPLGPDRHHGRVVGGAGSGRDSSLPAADPVDTTHEPVRLAAWTELHERIEALPEDEREAFELLWYQGMTRSDVATLLGVNERTVQRRWQAARLRLYRDLDGRTLVL